MVALVLDDKVRSKRTDLLWIEQDSVPNSAARSGPRTRHLINSHVQRFSKNSQRLIKARDLQTNLATVQRWRLDKPTERSTSSESSRSSSSDGVSNRSSLEIARTEVSQRPPRSSDNESLTSQSIQLPRSVGIRGEAIDPFNATTAKLDESVLQLLHYYIHVLVPSKWHVDSQSNQKLARIEAASQGVIRGCLANELHLYSLLASMASRMQNLEHWSVAPPTDLYIHKALVALRRYIDARPARIETQVFYDMFFLCTAEAYRYNLAASMTHLRAIAKLVEVDGGLNQLENHMLLETLVQGDIMLAVEQLSQPVFPLTWDPGSFPHARWEMIKMVTPLRDLGQAVLGDATLPPTLRTIVHEVVQCAQVAQFVWTHPESRKSDLEWIFLRYLAILHRLLTLKCVSWQPEAFRIALIMWLMIVMTSLGIRRSIKLIVPRLKQALLASEAEADEQPWSERSGLLLWVLAVGSFASVESSDEPWFVSRFAGVADRFGLRDEAQLRKLFRQYFFLESAQSASVSNLAGKLADYGVSTPLLAKPLTLRVDR